MRNLFGWSVVAVLVLGGVAGAQQPRPGTQPVRPGTQPVRPGVPAAGQPGAVAPGAQNMASQNNDQQIAAVIAICNRHEVEIAKFALPKLKSDKAKELATMLIKDHSEAADKFGKLAGPAGAVSTGARREGGDVREEGRREEGRREEGRSEEGRREEGRREGDRSDAKSTDATPERAASAPNNPGTRVVAQNAPNTGVAAPGAPRTAMRPVGGLNWVAIHQEVSDEGLAACKKELSKYEDNEFDKAFLGGQIAGHMKASAELKVFRRHVSSQLASEIDDALATTEDHLKQIKDLMEDKKDQGNK
jgi:predicted outer membrane protein